MDNKDGKIKSSFIEFEISKKDFKKVLSAHKRFAASGKNVEQSVLSWIKFTVKEDELTLTTTDGVRGLVSKLSIVQPIGDNGEFLLSMALVSKLSFIKGEFDIMLVHCESGKVEFIDPEFNQTQIIVTKSTSSERFPKIEQILSQKTDFTVTVSQSLIKDLAAMKAPKGYIDLLFNSKNNLQAILAKTESDEVSQSAILMPINKDNLKDDE